ncbi:MAG: NAD-dependent deacylase [Bacteroidetes bacterium]|nr:NAD-dependent deacylase [Bacteroidota bacterium]
MSRNDPDIQRAATAIRKSNFTTAYTGAGISVESGIPSFRGEGGLWTKYDPKLLDIDHFLLEPLRSWKTIKEIFYDHFGKARPNRAHFILAEMEKKGILGRTITQNIDNLHQEAGSTHVFDFHGNSRRLVCLSCGAIFPVGEVNLDVLPPTCRLCGGLLKPDYVFFGESIPHIALSAAYEAASISDVFLVIGTTGEVMPANQFPFLAKENGVTIIEINPVESHYTPAITDIFLKGKATEMMENLAEALFAPALENNQDGVNQDLEIHGE